MQIEDLLKKVHRLEIKTKMMSKHLFSGQYQSAFKGRGMSFSEVRSYQYGDDVRNMDWNVTARTGDPYIKVFEEERELTLMLVVDVSASSYFSSQAVDKQTFIAELCAVLAFSALQNNDKVGLLLFSNQVEKYIEPRKGKAHILHILRELMHFSPKNSTTDLNIAFDTLNNILKKRSICFFISDFFTQNYEKGVSITAKKHDLIGIQLTDALDEKLPNVGMLKVQDKETGDTFWLNTSDVKIQYEYQNNFLQYQLRFQNYFQKSGADTLSLRTSDDYIRQLIGFFKSRK